MSETSNIYAAAVSPEIDPKQTYLDGKPVQLAEIIKKWEVECLVERDTKINSFFGPRFTASGMGGMRGLVIQAHRNYTPRGWELPPYSKDSSELTQDIVHLSFPWFFGNTQQVMPVAAPSDLRIHATPLSGDKQLFAAYANAILEEESQYLKFDRHLKYLVLGKKLFGSQIAYYGVRDIRGQLDIQRVAEVCDPLSVLVDPNATCLEDAKYIIYKRWSRIEELETMYKPDFTIEAEQMTSDYSSTVLLANSSIAKSGDRAIETIVFVRDSAKVMETIAYEEEAPHVLVDEAGTPIPNPLNGQPQIVMRNAMNERQVQRFKYPFGRLIVLVNNKIVDDVALHEKYIHKRCPFVKIDNFIFPHTFWSMPDWYVAGDMAHVINESMSAIVKGARLGFSRMAIDQTALDGMTINEIENDPDVIIKIKADRIGKWHELVHLGNVSPDYINALLNAVNLSGKITGITDPLRGEANGEVRSGVQQQLLLQSAVKRINPEVKDLELYCEEAGHLVLYNAVQFRPPTDIFTLATNVTPQISEREFSIQDFPMNVEFKIKISPYSGLPTDRQERLQALLTIVPNVLAIYQQSPEFAEAIIKLSDIPELEMAYESFKVGMEQRAMAMQQMAALQQGSGIQPQAPQ